MEWNSIWYFGIERNKGNFPFPFLFESFEGVDYFEFKEFVRSYTTINYKTLTLKTRADTFPFTQTSDPGLIIFSVGANTSCLGQAQIHRRPSYPSTSLSS